METVAVGRFRVNARALWQRVEAGEEFVVTRNGKSIALLVPVESKYLQDLVRAVRAAQWGIELGRLQQKVRPK